MAFTLEELEESIETAREGLRQLFDTDVNGSDRYHDLIGAEIGQHPLYCGSHGPKVMVF